MKLKYAIVLFCLVPITFLDASQSKKELKQLIRKRIGSTIEFFKEHKLMVTDCPDSDMLLIDYYIDRTIEVHFPILLDSTLDDVKNLVKRTIIEASNIRFMLQFYKNIDTYLAAGKTTVTKLQEIESLVLRIDSNMLDFSNNITHAIKNMPAKSKKRKKQWCFCTVPLTLLERCEKACVNFYDTSAQTTLELLPVFRDDD